MFGFAKANKKIHRIGAETVKCVFSIDVRRVIFDGDSGIDYDGAALSVCFERGGKLASSKDHTFSYTKPSKNSRNSNTLDINETLSLVVTLYKGNNGEYQEKTGKLILRQLKKNKNILMSHMNNYKGVDAIDLPLHSLVGEITGIKDKTFQFPTLDDLSIEAKLSVRFIGVGDDDDMSMISENSDISMVAANFDSEVTTPHVFETLQEDEEEETQESPQKQKKKGKEKEVEVDDEQPKETKVKKNKKKNDEENENETTNESSSKHKRFPFLSAFESNDKNNKDSSSGKNSLFTKRNNSSEPNDFQNDSESLRKQLLNKDKEISQLKDQLRQQEEESKSQLLTARTDLNVAQNELRRLNLGRSAVAVANEKADGVLASALARAREETALVAEEFARASAELSCAEDACARAEEECLRLREEAASERESLVECARLLSESRARALELEEEGAALLQGLIEAKMRCAELAEEAERERGLRGRLRGRLQRYAERVAAMEVARTINN